MPEEKTEPLANTHVDNLEVQLRPGDGKIICQWDTGYIEAGEFVKVGSQGHIFNGSNYNVLSEGKDFKPNKTNYENIRSVVYAALHDAGVI